MVELLCVAFPRTVDQPWAFWACVCSPPVRLNIPSGLAQKWHSHLPQVKSLLGDVISLIPSNGNKIKYQQLLRSQEPFLSENSQAPLQDTIPLLAASGCIAVLQGALSTAAILPERRFMHV